MLVEIEEHIKTLTGDEARWHVEQLMGYKKSKKCHVFPTEVIKSGMLKWSNDTWPSIFDGNFIPIKITDYSHQYNLPTRRRLIIEMADYYKYSKYGVRYNGFSKDQFIVISRDGEKASRTTLTLLELEEALANMSEIDIDRYHRYRKSRLKSYIKHDLDGTPTVERPILFYMGSKDDYSMSATFKTREEALKRLNDIENNPVHEELREFVFTN